MENQVKRITASEILALLQAGKTREEIRLMYGLNKTQMKQLFKAPSLKFRKTIREKTSPFIFEDDLSNATTANVSQQTVANNTVTAETATDTVTQAREENNPEIRSTDGGLV